jgi:peptide/nickel transport system permease protein
MPPLLRFLLRRLFSIPVTLIIVTACLYGIAMLTPVEVRAQLYLTPTELARGDVVKLSQRVAETYGLDDPFVVQYGRWLGRLLQGNWSYSPTLRGDVLPALLSRTAVTAEVTLLAVAVYLPLGLVAGVIAGAQRHRRPDHGFRLLAFAATSIPSFVLGLVLLAIFYTGLRWFPPNRASPATAAIVRSEEFRTITGMLTVDGLLNGRPEVTLDALRHLILPVVTLSVAQWATLGRVTRATTIDELQKSYITAAHARGLRPNRVLWRHAFRNVTGPALATGALAAASLLTGVFIVEIIFNLRGVSEVVTAWALNRNRILQIPDAPAMLGFAVYSVIVVQLLMLVLDVAQALLDPRLRTRLVNP